MKDPFNRDRSVNYGVAASLMPGVRRITCANASAMTFTGTQSYIIGTGAVALIDPGPDDPAHRDALLRALEPGERISHIIVTHTHADHSPGAWPLARETGARVLGFGPHGCAMSPTMQALAASGHDLGGGEGGDPGFKPEISVAEGDEIRGANWSLRVLHTPGHLSNHICLAWEDAGAFFSGDTLMGWATTVVSPPQGDMAALMCSLARLAKRPEQIFFPGHGHPIDDPQAMVQYQIDHRRARFAQILAALGDGPQTPATLTARIYSDVAPSLLPAAQRNVLASLIGLVDQKEVACLDPIGTQARFALRQK